jgi:hypothetical protein
MADISDEGPGTTKFRKFRDMMLFNKHGGRGIRDTSDASVAEREFGECVERNPNPKLQVSRQ